MQQTVISGCSLEKIKGNVNEDVDSSDTREGKTINKTIDIQAPMQCNDGLYEFDDNFASVNHALFLNLPEYNPETLQKYPNGGPRQVPNSCAICLESYRVGDHLSWSANVCCTHAFHFSCIVPWCSKIIKEQPATKQCACPCCRQDFVKFDDDEDGHAESEAPSSGGHGEENWP
jgi:hypothetical protein